MKIDFTQQEVKKIFRDVSKQMAIKIEKGVNDYILDFEHNTALRRYLYSLIIQVVREELKDNNDPTKLK